MRLITIAKIQWSWGNYVITWLTTIGLSTPHPDCRRTDTASPVCALAEWDHGHQRNTADAAAACLHGRCNP